ncbi:MAG TPA: serine hydrolase, partial [Thermoanaerobaculia bacterium]
MNRPLTLLAILALTLPLTAQDLPPDLTAKIDAAANRILAMTGAPSASIAVVKDGRIAYAHAYGLANVETK